MWLTKRSRTDHQGDVSEKRSQPLPIQHIANFSYPRTDFVHLYNQIPADARDSRGSESSPPPMVEDHGSDISADDDSQHLSPGPDSWDSWHSRGQEARKPDYPALIKSSPGNHSPKPTMAQENPHMSHTSSLGSQSSPVTWPAVAASSVEQQPLVSKSPPKVSYSLFPPAYAAQRRPLVRVQIPSVPRQSRLEPSPLSLNFPPTPNSRSAIADGKGNVIPSFGPASSPAAAPGSARRGSIAASSSDSLPLLLRSPGPTPPDSPSDASSSSEAPSSSEPPRYPVRVRASSPSHRKFKISKNPTRSTPALASHIRGHQQGHAPDPPHHKPLTQADLHSRPLPPLPTEQPPPPPGAAPPPPPHVSVFEFDTDDEDEETGSRPGSGEAKKFARRLMHGLVHHHHHHHQHHHDRKAKGLSPSDHKRSVNDEGPSSSSSPRGHHHHNHRSGISRTFNHITRHRRNGASDAATSAARCAVSMDLPRDRDNAAAAAAAEGGMERNGRFWGHKGNGEMLLGKILRRKG